MSRRLLTLLVVLAAVLVPAPATAAQQDPGGADLVEACRDTAGGVPEAGERACRSLEQLFRDSAAFCRFLGVTPEECSRFDGRKVSEARMETFEASWVARALDLQRGLDDDVPLRLALTPHTHNSFNSAAYTPTFSGLDHNQVYSVEDQLRMGIRAIELDVHWAPSQHGDPEDGGFAPILCHGEPVPGGDPSVHAGCTTERHLETGLVEIRGWLDDNPDEVVIVYLENALDGREDAHAAAVDAIEGTLGDLVLRPDTDCADLPIDLSRADVRAAGKQVLLTGNCGPAAWGSWVHVRGEGWDERGAGTAASYPPAPACADRTTRDYDDRLVRIFEDSTWLTAMVDGTREPLTPDTTRDMVRCGVNLPGFDQLRPDDGRLEALVWSWAPDEPAAGDCAYQGADGRFRSDDCREVRPAACFDGTSWAVTKGRGAWDTGTKLCSGGTDGAFAAPRTGFANDALADATGDTGEVWLNYRRSVDGEWTPAAS